MKTDPSNHVSQYDGSHISEDVRAKLAGLNGDKAARVRDVADQKPSGPVTWGDHMAAAKKGPR